MSSVPAISYAAPRNIILFIGDGMGLEQIKLARTFDNGDAQPLVFETFPHFSLMTHNNASNHTTDSGASATAMATGVKVENGVISTRIPGDGSELTTALEILRDHGLRSGLVTHATELVDATPAAFGAHSPSRYTHGNIANDYLTQTRPNVLFGRSHNDLGDAQAIAAGYPVVHNAAELAAVDAATTERVLGHWNIANEPALSQLTAKALDILDNDPDGFFLLVEDEDPDNGGHANDRTTTKNGVLSLRDAVQTALDWAVGRENETLILVAADHETGGLAVLNNNGPDVLPDVSWSTTGHTQTPVGVFSRGAHSEFVRGTIDNTDIFRILTTPDWNVDADGNWSDAGNWFIGVPNGAGAKAYFGNAISADRTVMLDSTRTIGQLVFNNDHNYTIAGEATLTLSGQSRLIVTSGHHAITAPLALSEDATVDVAAAQSLTLSGAISSAAGASLTKVGGGVLETSSVATDELIITGGTIRLLPSSGAADIGALTIDPGANLDLDQSALVVREMNSSEIQQLIVQGFNDGDWLGSGITSSAAAQDPTFASAIGVAENSQLDYTTFAGITDLIGNEVFIRYTYYGDADLGGTVNLDDFNQFLFGYNNGAVGPPAIWLNGDFDYNGSINLDDFNQFLFGLQNQGGALVSPELFAALSTFVTRETLDVDLNAVPEPASAALVALASPLLARRRRRQQQAQLC